MRVKKTKIAIGAITTALALTLTGCAGSDTNNSGSIEVSSEISDNAEDGINKGEQLTPESATPEGSIRITNASNLNDDAYRLDVFIDPACGACQRVESTLGERWAEEAESGIIDYHIIPVPFLDEATEGDYSTRASNAFITIAEEDPIMATQFLAKLYEPGFFPNHGPTHRETSDAKLAELAKEVGASDELTEKMAEHHYIDWLENNTEKFAENKTLFPDGIFTPNVLLGLEYNENGELTNNNVTQVQFSGNIEGDYETQLEQYLN